MNFKQIVEGVKAAQIILTEAKAAYESEKRRIEKEQIYRRDI
jgi:hypothetical protein